jgi:hypothetical protein
MISMIDMRRIAEALPNCRLLAHFQGSAFIIDNNVETVGFIDMVGATLVIREDYIHLERAKTVLDNLGITYSVQFVHDAKLMYPSLVQKKG